MVKQMTKLEKLIKELCPNSMEYKRLGDICRLVTGAISSTAKSAYWDNGTIPWMSSGELNSKRVWSTEQKILN